MNKISQNISQNRVGTGRARLSLMAMALVATTLVFGSACSTGSYTEQRTEQRTEQWHFEATPDTRLSIGNVHGSIRIETREGKGIDVQAVIRAKTKEDLERLFVEVKQDGEHIRLARKVRKKGWFNRNGVNGSIDFIVQAPASTRLDAIDTVSGDVTVLGNSKAVNVDTVNGDVDLQRMTGSVSVDVVNGDITLEMQRLGEGQKVELDSVNGDMKITLPADASARLQIDTVNGDIKTEGFDINQDTGWVGKEARVELGSGKALLSLDTVNGDMEIIKQ